MADKKLSDVTSVEDFDYFLGVKSNGDVQKMSKDSMKKVISELMSSFLQIDSPKNFIVSNPSNMETGIISIGDASREISKSEKLNEPSEDIPFIRGMDSNGNPIYIGTEQFSSVLAELVGVATPKKSGLHPAAKFSQSDNSGVASIDDITVLSTDIYNGKILERSSTFIIKTYPASPSYMYQEAMCMYPYERYWRAKVDGSWRAWNKI